jgi:toxin ParE1/3/4
MRLIWNYTLKEWSKKQADKYIDELNDTIFKIYKNPFLMPERKICSPPVRAYQFKSHLIFYTTYDDKIQIDRILHQSQDWLGILS